VWLWRRGVDATLFHPDCHDEQIRKALAPHGELLVGYVGRLAVEKRIDLLATVSRRPFIKVVIIGDGRDACTVRPGRTRAGRESHVDSRG
jgi:phosphatidylinositol alpha 1,6-mannosyltransferase